MSAVLTVRPFRPGDEQRWDAYVDAAPGSHFGQRIAWMRLIERWYGAVPDYRLAEERDEIRGVLPLFAKRGGELFSAPGGLLADDDEVARALIEPARERVAREGLRWLELRDQRRAWPGLETSREHVTLELPLAADADRQWRTFDAKLRNQVRKAGKSGLTLAWDRARVADFHRVLLENMRDLGTPIRSAAFFRAALDALGPRADLLLVDLERRAVGALFLVVHGGAATDPWASSLRRAFDRCPNHALYWAAIRRAIELGLRRFDLGRSQWDSGTYGFKAQWGAQPVPLFYQYALGRGARVPTLAEQRTRYDAVVRMWRRLPVPLAVMLGEPLRRRFPEVL